MLDLTGTKLSLSRSIWSYHKVRLFVAAVIRNRSAFRNRKTSGLILDVGCGPNANARNINLDYEWRPGVDVCCDITRGLPFHNGYVAGIFTEHCIEHVRFDDALFVLGEFRRVMASGAWVRIIVPDLEIYVDHYQAFRTGRELSMPYSEDDVRPDGIYSPAMSINRIFRAHGHQFIYDFATLNAMLEKTGFIEIRKTKFGDSRDSRLLHDTPNREIESLYVEARRP
jgi:predicted SAM-dependent methyltransferase